MGRCHGNAFAPRLRLWLPLVTIAVDGEERSQFQRRCSLDDLNSVDKNAKHDKAQYQGEGAFPEDCITR